MSYTTRTRGSRNVRIPNEFADFLKEKASKSNLHVSSVAIEVSKYLKSVGWEITPPKVITRRRRKDNGNMF